MRFHTERRDTTCLGAVELLATLGVVNKEGRGLELRAKGVAVAEHLVNKLLGAVSVDEAEGAAACGREADTEHGANVCCMRLLQEGRRSVSFEASKVISNGDLSLYKTEGFFSLSLSLSLSLSPKIDHL